MMRERESAVTYSKTCEHVVNIMRKNRIGIVVPGRMGNPRSPNTITHKSVNTVFNKMSKMHAVYTSNNDGVYQVRALAFSNKMAQKIADTAVEDVPKTNYAAVSPVGSGFEEDLTRSKLDQQGHHYFTEQ